MKILNKSLIVSTNFFLISFTCASCEALFTPLLFPKLNDKINLFIFFYIHSPLPDFISSSSFITFLFFIVSITPINLNLFLPLHLFIPSISTHLFINFFDGAIFHHFLPFFFTTFFIYFIH